jgi:hypothetical protein
LMARNPLPLVVPCHRVVASDGLASSSSRACFRPGSTSATSDSPVASRHGARPARRQRTSGLARRSRL